MNKPKKLYKYETISVQSLLNLKSQALYFSAPANFNDPYDCAIRARVREPSDIEIDEFREKYSKIEELPEVTRQQLTSVPKDQLKMWLMRVGQQSAAQIVEKNIESRGVTCFSEINNELLMWSHYADKYKGFCLEFDTSYEPFSKVRKVRYEETMPTLSITDALIRNDYDQFLELYCTKSMSWSYEKEWRCIHHVAGTRWTYEANALTGVYFGPEIDPEALEIICLVLQGQNENVKFWKGERSAERFSVEFKKIEYTSHLDAKRRGILT